MEPILGRAYFTCAAGQRQEQNPVSSCGRKPLRTKGLNSSRGDAEIFTAIVNFNGPTLQKRMGRRLLARAPHNKLLTTTDVSYHNREWFHS